MKTIHRNYSPEPILDPIFINQDFLKYLDGKQLKFLGAILTCKQYEQFYPTNKFIAFFGGFNDMKEVENIKKSLINIGLLKTDMTLNLKDWERRVHKI